MRGAVERWLHERWYGNEPPGLGLRAVAGLYRVAASLAPRPTPVPLGAPVIVVGNFTAGGTGKTPVAIALAEHLRARGFRPGIVTRGHGRQATTAVRVQDDTPVEQCGDEPKLMFERTGLPVLVDRDRVAAARAALAAGCNLLIADDGLQHGRLHRDIEIEVVDAARGYGNGLLLPAGPLRERPRRCDLRVVNGASVAGANPSDWPMQLTLGDARAIDSAKTRPLTEFSTGAVHGVAGIGNPERFFDALRGRGIAVLAHPFDDHHRYLPDDFRDLSGPILMTEKDAVKCRGLGLRDAWAVPVDATLPEGFFAAVDALLGRSKVK